MRNMVIALVALVFLAACGNNSERLSLGLIQPSLNHLPVLYGLEEGIIDSSAIDIYYFSSGWEVNEALIAGKLDAAIMPFTYAWTDVSRGYPVRIASFLERESDGILTSKEHKDIQSLKGAKVGVLRASTIDIFARMLSKREKLGWEFVAFRSPNEMSAALMAGEVDALSFYVPPIFKMGEDYHIVCWYSDYFPKHPCCDLVIHESALSVHEQDIRNLAAGIAHSVKKMEEDREKLLYVALKYFPIPKRLLENSIAHTHYQCGIESEGIDFEKESFRAMMDAGYIERDVDPGKIYFNIQGK